MEMVVALSAFLERIPEFQLDDSGPVTWCGGQVRGPRLIPLAFTAT
jgi:cytochrome P450